MRRIAIDYLGLRDKISPKEGMAIPLSQLDTDAIQSKLNSWGLFQQMGDAQKNAAIEVINKGNASLGDLIDALAAGPQVMSQPSLAPGLDSGI
jgi:hypothetical protein